MDVDIRFDDQTKQFKFSELSKSLETDLIVLHDFLLSPLDVYPEFFRQLTIQKNHITLNVEKAELKAFRATPFITEKFVDAESVTISGMDFSFVKDYR